MAGDRQMLVGDAVDRVSAPGKRGGRDDLERLPPVGREPYERRTVVTGVQFVAGEAVRHEQIGNALHVLTGDAEASRRRGDRPIPLGNDAQHLPPRLGLTNSRGEFVAMAAQSARRLKHVGDQQREMLSFLHIDNLLSCWPTVGMNIDLFTLPHKALRALVGLTAIRLGALDAANAREVEQMQDKLHGLADELQSHGAHEDEFILPLLERYLPDLATRMRAEHAEVEGGLADIRRAIAAFGAAPSAARQLALYRQLRRFEGLNLRHLDFEETIVMPALWQAAPAQDLTDLMTEFRAAHPEAGDLYRQAPEALTTGERTMVGV